MSGENSIRMQFGMKHVLLMIVTMALIVLPVVYFRDYRIVVSIWLTFITVALWCRPERASADSAGTSVAVLRLFSRAWYQRGKLRLRCSGKALRPRSGL